MISSYIFYSNLVDGVILFTLGVTLLLLQVKKTQKVKKGDYILYGNQIKIYLGCSLLIILGLIFIYKYFN